MATITYDDVLYRTLALVERTCAKRATEESRFIEDLELDSIDLVGLVSDMEEEFQVFVPEAQLHTFRTVSDATRCLHELLAERDEGEREQVA
jgi:acyl carrier protein